MLSMEERLVTCKYITLNDVILCYILFWDIRLFVFIGLPCGLVESEKSHWKFWEEIIMNRQLKTDLIFLLKNARPL